MKPKEYITTDPNSRKTPKEGMFAKCVTQSRKELDSTATLENARGNVRVVHPQPVNDKELAYRWEEKDDMIKHNGTWKKKIDFVMDVLSPSYVTAELKAITGGKSFSALLDSPGWVPAYKCCLETLCTRAREQEDIIRQKRLSTGDFSDLSY